MCIRDSSDIVIGKLFRLRIVLINGYSISLVNGPLTRSSINDGKITFEVGVIDRNGDLDYSLTDGDLLSHQDFRDLLSLIERVLKTYP